VTWIDVENVPPENWKPNTKYLYTLASTNGWTHAQVKDFVLFNFKRASTKDLAFEEYNKVIDALDKLPPGSMSMTKDKNTLELFE
jgi:hypothetical protein